MRSPTIIKPPFVSPYLAQYSYYINQKCMFYPNTVYSGLIFVLFTRKDLTTLMDAPQNNRRPPDLTKDEKRWLLRQKHADDSSDPFVTDPHPQISELGKLGLRVDDDLKIDYYITIGDICATLILRDERLRIFYVGKAMIAYQKAYDFALLGVDKPMIRRAIDELASWVVNMAMVYPSQRNYAVALWIVADDEESLISPAIPLDTITNLIHFYQSLVNEDDNKTLYGQQEDESATRADILASDILSDFSRTMAAEDESFIGSMDESQAIDETRIGMSVEVPLSEVESQEKDDDNSAERFDKNKQTAIQHEFDIRDMIENRYEVVNVKLGGMGVVYLCYDHDYREPVAIKSFQERFLDNANAVARFEQEAAIWMSLDKHPHLVQARLVRNINGRPHIILEHISGMESMGADLRSWINSKRLTLQQVMKFALHIALGMQHAQTKQAGLVHRDLKPGNIMVTHESIAKITDFGLVSSVEKEKDNPFSDTITMTETTGQNDRLTRLDAVVGTPPYMSPEQIRSRDVDIRADIYSFGIILYEMLCWKHPFIAHGVKEWRDAHMTVQPRFPKDTPFDIPSSIQTLALRCLEKDARNRPQTWDDLVHNISNLFAEEFGETPILEYSNIRLEVREMVNKGYSLTELGRYEDALDAYNEAIDMQEDYAWAWGRKGRTLRLLERYDDALICYDKALEIKPDDAWSWNGKGIVLERMKHYEDALRHYEMATQLEPSYVWYWFNRGGVLKEIGRNDEAIVMIKRALTIDPNHFNSHAKLGQIYRVQDKHRDSLKAYEKAIALESDYAWAYNGYGLTLRAMKHYDEAIVAFRKAIRYQADGIWNWYNLAETLVDTDQYLEALNPAQQITILNPNFSYGWGKLGQVYRKLNRFEDALEAYSQAIELDPNYAWAINGKGLVLEHLKHYQEALDCYEKATSIKQDSAWYWHNQGNALYLMNQHELALEILQKAVEVQADYINSWILMSTIQREHGNYEQSLASSQRVIAINPAYAHAWNEKGMTLEAMQDYGEALIAYKKAARYSTNQTAYLYKQADVLVFQEKFEEARVLLEQALKINNRVAYIWAKNGQVLRKLNRLEEALNSYNHAVELDTNYAWAWSGRGLTLSLLGYHDEALHCFKQAVELDASDVWYWYNYAEELILHNDYETALEVLDEALSINPQHAESWSKIGQCLRGLNQLDEAIKAYRKAVEILPDFAWAWNGLGLTLRSMGQMEDALSAYEQAIQHAPDIIWYHINFMTTLLTIGRLDEALTVIENALKINPEHPTIWARHGQVLRRMEKYELALASYSKAVDYDSTYAWAWNGKGMCHTALDDPKSALDCYLNAVKYDNTDVWFMHNCGHALYLISQLSNEDSKPVPDKDLLQKAKEALEKALKIDPNHEPSRALLRDIGEELDK